MLMPKIVLERPQRLWIPCDAQKEWGLVPIRACPGAIFRDELHFFIPSTPVVRRHRWLCVRTVVTISRCLVVIVA